MADPVPAQKAPYEFQVEAGRRYAWCSCGLSKAQPLCDGAHGGTGLIPMVFQADETKTVYLCGCKATKGQPFCDGAHSGL
ncbi:MAG: CDGSH iron-sulfur domain-containing protein [Planctomycetota bacterium]